MRELFPVPTPGGGEWSLCYVSRHLISVTHNPRLLPSTMSHTALWADPLMDENNNDMVTSGKLFYPFLAVQNSSSGNPSILALRSTPWWWKPQKGAKWTSVVCLYTVQCALCRHGCLQLQKIPIANIVFELQFIFGTWNPCLQWHNYSLQQEKRHFFNF